MPSVVEAPFRRFRIPYLEYAAPYLTLIGLVNGGLPL